MVDEHQILLDILSRHEDADKWNNQPFEHIKRISNSKVGDVGQDFVEVLCGEYRLACVFPEKDGDIRMRQSSWDIEIEGVRFELKTASEDVSGSFQFNHIRYHRDYDALLCIGIAPATIHIGAWFKANVATGNAGRLVSMEKSANASYKLTKRPDQLRPIAEFETLILGLVTAPNA